MTAATPLHRPAPEWDSTFTFDPAAICAGCHQPLSPYPGFPERVLTDGERFAHNFFHAVLADQAVAR